MGIIQYELVGVCVVVVHVLIRGHVKSQSIVNRSSVGASVSSSWPVTRTVGGDHSKSHTQQTHSHTEREKEATPQNTVRTRHHTKSIDDERGFLTSLRVYALSQM